MLTGQLNEEWLLGLFHTMEYGVIIADSEFKMIAINPAAEKLLGCSPAEIDGENYFDFLKRFNPVLESYSPDTLNAQIENRRLVLLDIPTKGKTSFEERIKKTGSDTHNEAFLIFLNNLQEHKVKIDDYGENERKYKELFENILEGIFILDDNGYVIDANPAACRIYQLQKDDFIGKHVSFLFPHKTYEEAVMIWQEFMQTGLLEGFYRFTTKRQNEVKYIDFKARTNFLPGLHLAVFSDVTEKTITEKALRSSEANLRAIFNHTRQLLILLDPDLRIITYNEEAQKSTYENSGRLLEVGRYIYEYGNPDDKDAYAPIYERVRQGESIFLEIQTTFYKNKDNWLEVGFIPVFDGKKAFKGYLISSTDITYRKKAELSLSESEARFRSMVQNSSDIITILSPEAKIKYTSASIIKILGYKEEDLLGKNLIDFVHKEDKDLVKNLLKKFLEGIQINPVLEYRFLHAEGFYVYLETTWNNFLKNEHIQGIVLNSRDVSERKHQEENLLLLERAIDSSVNGIIITDPNQPDNPVIYANKAYEQITGYTYFEIIGKNSRYLQKNDRNQPEIEEIRKGLLQHKEVRVVLRNYRKDGKLFWNQLSISPVFNRNGELTNYIGVINDITEKKIGEDALLEITQGISSEADSDIYKALVAHIGMRLGMDIVFIGEFSGDKISLKAFWEDGLIRENTEYNILNSPCADVLEKNVCCSYEDVQNKFPYFPILKEKNIHSYMAVPLRDSNGKTIGIFSILSKKPFINIQLAESILNIFSIRASTELERDHYISALKSSETRFRDLAKNSPDIIYIIDLEMKKVVYFNKEIILGYDSEELRDSDSWMLIVHPDDIARVKQHWKQFLESKKNVTRGIEYRIMNKDGIYEWVINRHIVLEWTPDKQPKQVLLNLSVITERKKTEEALRESEARLTALIENTNDIMWSVDRDFYFTTMNSSFRTLMLIFYGTKIDLGENLKEVLPKQIRDEWVDYHEKALAGQRFSVEFSLGASTGEISYEISYNPIYSDKGLISGVSVFGRDITQRKHAENDIMRTNFELDSFVYRASHDLRAPLRSVLGLINLARYEMDQNERNLYLGLVEKSVNKLDTFISDLTNFSRNSRLEVNVNKINFRQIIEDAFDNLKYMDNAERIKSYININEEEEFFSDPTRISIVMQNLISNAIKYQNTRIEDSYVKITIAVSKKLAEISVEDNGKGIREEYIDKIFNMFFRASQESYGSGLGLYIARQVVEKLGGNISVTSKLGSGSRFVIKLPNLM
jgi:PAS domain S-box-containing protein